jgi:hypothetical protein
MYRCCLTALPKIKQAARQQQAAAGEGAPGFRDFQETKHD